MLELLIVKISKSYSFSSSFMNKKTTTSLLNPVRRLYTYRWFATTNTFWNKHNAASNKKHNEEHNEEMFLINVSAKSQNVPNVISPSMYWINFPNNICLWQVKYE